MDVEICEICKGLGTVKEYAAFHSYDYEIVKCSNCNGTGRVKRFSYSFNVPFDIDMNIIYKYDTEIHNLIRKLKAEQK